MSDYSPKTIEPETDSQVEQAEARTEQAEKRTEQAEARTEQAKTRIEQAETRIEQAEIRTEQAETRTEQAKTRTEQAEIRTEQAETLSEQAVHASELRYRRLFETAQDGILILDAGTGQVVDANPFMKDLLGYSQEEILGKKLWEIGPFKGVAASKIAFADLQRSDRIRYEGLPLETKDGQLVEVEFISNAYLVDHARLIQCNIRDITERKLAEKARRESEDRYRTLFEHAPDGIVIANPESYYIDANASMCRMLGYQRDELIGLHASNIVTAAETAQIAPALDMIKSRTDYQREWQFQRKDGSLFRADVIATLMPDGNLLGMVRDITDRKRAEDQIADQASFLDKTRDAILDCDLEGTILFWNKGAERIYGWNSQEAVGRKVVDLLYATPELFEKNLDIILEKGELTGEVDHLTKDRHTLAVEVRRTLVRDNEGHPKSILAIITDITERKKIEAQFMRAQRMESIGTLAGGIAHDLNNILTPIMLSIDMLKTTSSDPKTVKILQTIEVSAKRGADIVRQVLSFARGLEGQRIEVQPKHLLKDLESIIKDTFPKDIQLHFSVPNDTWTILGDPTQVHQILMNLCVNARDAMPHGGSLTIDVENCVLDAQFSAMSPEAKPGRYVNISVTDTGSGIPPDVLDKIFEPFFTTKELNKGTGLGLSTVLAIVKSHEGIVNVYSEPGKGTTFKVYLPAMELSAQAKVNESDQTALPRGNGEIILVVDDEASILVITSQTLQAFGYQVLTATDGAEAVALYAQRRNEIAVVLTDMMMPVMGGEAVIRVLTRINPAIKIIAASGLCANVNLARVPGSGVEHFLTKPYTAGALLKTLRAILEKA